MFWRRGRRRKALGMWTSRDKGISSPVKASPSGIFGDTLHPKSDQGKVTCLSLSRQQGDIFTHPHFRCAGKAVAGFKIITALFLDFLSCQECRHPAVIQKQIPLTRFFLQSLGQDAAWGSCSVAPVRLVSGERACGIWEEEEPRQRASPCFMIVCVEGGRRQLAMSETSFGPSHSNLSYSLLFLISLQKNC